jgi:AraC-like DNA-binding protein
MVLPTSPANLAAHFEVRLQWKARHQWYAGQTLSQVFHGCYGLWLVEDGILQAQTPDSSFSLSPGQALLWPPNLPRTLHAGDGSAHSPGANWLTLGLHAQLFGHLEILPLLPSPHLWQPTPEEFVLLRTLMATIVDAPATSEGALLRDGLCRAVVALFWQQLRGDDLIAATRQTLPDWLQKTLALAHNQPEVGVAELARTAAFSPAQFRRSFARWMQQSPRDYLQNHRLETARNLLENTNLPINHIAEQLHFASPTHFGRAWKKKYGLTPAAYRKQSQSAHQGL